MGGAGRCAAGFSQVGASIELVRRVQCRSAV